jgi:arabinose-5-phosphate isomerase
MPMPTFMPFHGGVPQAGGNEFSERGRRGADESCRRKGYLGNRMASLLKPDSAVLEQRTVQRTRLAGLDVLAKAREVLAKQGNAVLELASGLDETFEGAVRTVLDCNGRVAVSGMGKSGLVGRKLAATLSSTGTPAYFLHPADALHGDLGAICPEDVVILISNSGETEELLRLLPSLEDFGNPVIAMTTAGSSTLARHATVVLCMPFEGEVCPNNLAPTTSTLITMALGDALAVALIEARGFTPSDFARLHPGGSLGRRLLRRVRDAMHANVPSVSPDTALHDAIAVMTTGRLGLVAVSMNGELQGLFTDGDLRRALAGGGSVLDAPVSRFMTSRPLTISPDVRLADALALMVERSVRVLVVLDHSAAVVGVLDILAAEC